MGHRDHSNFGGSKQGWDESLIKRNIRFLNWKNTHKQGGEGTRGGNFGFFKEVGG